MATSRDQPLAVRPSLALSHGRDSIIGESCVGRETRRESVLSFGHSLSSSDSILRGTPWRVFCGILFHNSKVDLLTSGHSRRVLWKKRRGRKHWMGRVDCTMSLIAAVVGLGNLTQFPFLVRQHDAGAFVFAVLLLSAVMGVPLFYLEACLGQLTGQGAVLGWGGVPLFKGLGISLGMTSAILSVYYSLLCTYPLFYFGSSFLIPLPWSHCNNSWNTKECVSVSQCIQRGTVRVRNASQVVIDTSFCLLPQGAPTGAFNQFSSHQFWVEKVHGKGQIGPVQSHLVFCLFTVWFLCFLVLLRDVLSLGKIMIVSMIIMGLMLVVLVSNGAMLGHSSEGISYFLTPKWETWQNSEMWFAASGESFFGITLGTGVISTLSSYSRYRAGDPLRMSVCVVMIDALVSIIGGFVFFTRLSYLAYELGQPLEKLPIFTGSTLTYIIYPESVVDDKVGPFLSIMFFFSLFGAGITSQIGFVHVMSTAIFDKYPLLTRRRYLTLFLLCLAGFFLALPFTLKGGDKWVSALSVKVTPVCLLINGFLEVTVVAWAYGINNLNEQIERMIGRVPSRYFSICWKYLAPIFLLVLLLWAFVSKHDNSTEVTVAEMVSLIPLLSFLLSIVYMLFQRHDLPLLQRVRTLLTPAARWTRCPVKEQPLPLRSSSHAHARKSVDIQLINSSIASERLMDLKKRSDLSGYAGTSAKGELLVPLGVPDPRRGSVGILKKVEQRTSSS